MAKLVAPGIQVQRQTTPAPEARINQYVQLLWVVAAGGLGIALLCVAASIGLADTNLSASAALQSRSIVDLAIANVNTAQALTVEAFSGLLPELTAFPPDTATSNPTSTITSIPSLTPTVIASRTSIPLTRTRRPGDGFFFPTNTQIFLPTQTNTSQPPPTITKTFIPTGTSAPPPTPTVFTKTPKPTRTRTSTPIPHTRTPIPRPTKTLTPVPTDTSIPPPPATDTPIPPPPPTDTSAPPPPVTDTSEPPPQPTDTSAPPPAPTDTSGPLVSTNTP